jgi:OmcA/MtrC family decaheme c-type cytochrome
MKSKFIRSSLAALVAAGTLTLAGCGGSDGAAGPAGPAGPPGAAAVNLAALTPEQWAGASFKSEVTSVTIASPPVVEFTVADVVGNPVVGFEKLTSKSSTATIASYPNLSFAIAKLVPRTDNKPSTWVSYIVTNVSTANAAVTLTRPTTDNIGTLVAVDNKPGTYRYTFYRDVPGMKAQVDGITPPAGSDKADLGDLTYEPSLPHRLTIQIGGAAPGTGTNVPNAVQTTPAVNLVNAINVTYDFRPGPLGQPGTPIPVAELTREDVNIASCNVCHGKLAVHGGSARVETRYCVVCHTEQRAYGQTKVTSTAGKFPALTETKTVNALTGITSYSYSPQTAVADGEVSGNFNTLIHKMHQGNWLVKDNYNYANAVFNNKGFSKLGGGQRMCTTCHDSKVAATADNYKNLPSRLACGACHDGINFADGTGSTLRDKQAATAVGAVVATSGHRGGAHADDSKCSTCHSPTFVPIDHRMENLTKNNNYILPGLASFTYQIDTVGVNATSNDVTIKFRILRRIAPAAAGTETPVTLNAPSANGNPLAGYSSNVGFLLGYAMPQDGIAAPIDYNNRGIKQAQPISVSLAALLNTSTSTTSANIGTVGSVSATADANGYYTATIRGDGSAVCGGAATPVKCVFPVGAKLRTVALQGYFTQLGAPTNNPRDPATVGDVGRHAISVVKTVTGDTPRRTVVAADKCAGCHEWFEGHGGSRVYETQVCVFCHNPGLASSGRGIGDAASGTFPGLNNWTFDAATTRIITDWGFDKTLPNAALKFPVTSNNFKDMIHGIHAGRDRRVLPFQTARDRTSTTGAGGGVIQLLDFRRMDFPGRLNNCETCHTTAVTSDQKTYNFVPASTLVSTYESIDAPYAAAITGNTATPALAKTALNTSNPTDVVVTPFAAACVSCHDSTPSKAHISIMGGALNVTRAAAQPTPRPLEDVESCVVCHGPGRDFDTEKVHKR